MDVNQDGWISGAEVFGKGLDLWLPSQGDKIEQVE